MSQQNAPALPVGWTWVHLPELGELNRGKSKHRPRNDEKLFGGDYPFIQTGDVRNSNGVIHKYSATYNETGLKQSRLWPIGTLCITIAANIAETANLGIPACFPDSIVGFIADSEKCTAKYVRYYFELIKQEIDSYAPATAQKNINLQMLGDIIIPIPNPSEQHRIVSKIEELFSKLDAGVTALERAKANLKRYRASVLKAAMEGKLTEKWRAENPNKEPASKLLERILEERRCKWEEEQQANYKAKGQKPPKDWRFKYKEPAKPDTADLPELPEGWCWARLDSIAEIKGGITVDKKRVVRDGQLVPYLRVANVQRGYLDLSEIKEIEANDSTIELLQLHEGDVLFTEGGDRDKLGRGWIWNNELPVCIYQNHIFRARPYIADVSPKFISWFGNALGQEYFMAKGKQTTNLASISLTMLRAFPVALPPRAEQDKISDELEGYLSVLDEMDAFVQASLARAARLRQAILKHAFEGKLVPQDPNDEPAGMLLERIQAERAKSSEAPKTKKLKPRRNAAKGQNKLKYDNAD